MLLLLLLLFRTLVRDFATDVLYILVVVYSTKKYVNVVVDAGFLIAGVDVAIDVASVLVVLLLSLALGHSSCVLGLHWCSCVGVTVWLFLLVLLMICVLVIVFVVVSSLSYRRRSRFFVHTPTAILQACGFDGEAPAIIGRPTLGVRLCDRCGFIQNLVGPKGCRRARPPPPLGDFPTKHSSLHIGVGTTGHTIWPTHSDH